MAIVALTPPKAGLELGHTPLLGVSRQAQGTWEGSALPSRGEAPRPGLRPLGAARLPADARTALPGPPRSGVQGPQLGGCTSTSFPPGLSVSQWGHVSLALEVSSGSVLECISCFDKQRPMTFVSPFVCRARCSSHRPPMGSVLTGSHSRSLSHSAVHPTTFRMCQVQVPGTQ